jgi:hypothetical protein
MTKEHASYEELAAQRRRSSDEYRAGYAEACRAFLIGQAVRERRLALGLSQVELAARAGMTQPPSPGWKQAESCLRSTPRGPGCRGPVPAAAQHNFAQPTATRPGTPTRRPSTSPGRTPATWPSATASTTAWVPGWPGSKA